jgi:hypothetical protein
MAGEEAPHQFAESVQIFCRRPVLRGLAVADELGKRRVGRCRLEPRDGLRHQLVDVPKRGQQAAFVVGL